MWFLDSLSMMMESLSTSIISKTSRASERNSAENSSSAAAAWLVAFLGPGVFGALAKGAAVAFPFPLRREGRKGVQCQPVEVRGEAAAHRGEGGPSARLWRLQRVLRAAAATGPPWCDRLKAAVGRGRFTGLTGVDSIKIAGAIPRPPTGDITRVAFGEWLGKVNRK